MMMPSIFGENLFDEMMDFPFGSGTFETYRPFYGKKTADLMKTDVKDLEGVYELDIDLPGFKKEDIQAKLENGYLTIQADTKQETESKDKYIRRERYEGHCSRSFYVGEGVTQEQIQAKFEDGILKLRVPKEEAKTIPEKKYIAIEG